MVIRNVLSPFELECWVDAYRISDSEYVYSQCQKLKPVLLSVVLEILDQPFERLFADAERRVLKKNIINQLRPYVDRALDLKNFQYQVELFSSSEGAGKEICDSSFLRCIATRDKSHCEFFPIDMNVAVSLEKYALVSGGSKNSYPFLLSSDQVRAACPEIPCSFFRGNKFWLDILLNPDESVGVDDRWLLENHYLGTEPSFTLFDR